MRKSRSIRTKFLGSIILIFIIFAVIIAMVGVANVSRLSKEDSKLMMNQICDRETLRFENHLKLIEHSVLMISDYANQEMRRYWEGVIYTPECENKIRDLAISIAEETEGAISVYFRYNPLIVESGTEGFLWAYDQIAGNFQEQLPTNILLYKETDMEHVGWFYAARDAGEAMWLAPYFNKNLNRFMISYVCPIYKSNGEFVGVIGMDIDFDDLIHTLDNNQIYETGKVRLADLSNRCIYYVDSEDGAESLRLDDTLYYHMIRDDDPDQVLTHYSPEGKKEVLCFNELSNGMCLYVSVPNVEIHSNRNTLIIEFLLWSVLALIVTTVIITRQMNKIIVPIKRLAEITNGYAKGDWSKQYISESGDEIEELSVSIAKMAITTQTYIHQVRDDARKDGLTGLRNKTYYMEYVEQLKRESQTKNISYGIVVFDLNYLKKANDTYGHEVGDVLIMTAANYISNCFSNSMVFRIGGDEFVAILKREELENHEALLETFEQGLYSQVSGAYGLQLSIASGFAEYGVDGREYEVIFQMADARMYEKKHLMNAERG